MHVLFLCPHGAAKSVIATAMMRELAGRLGVEVTASSAGTHPDLEINPMVREELRARNLGFTDMPRLLTREDVAHADIVVSLGCALDELPEVPRRFVDWSDAPDVSENVEALSRMLSSRLPSLLDR